LPSVIWSKPGPVWQSLQHVITAGQRAKELVQQILTFSRHHAPQRQPLRLHLLIHETLRFCVRWHCRPSTFVPSSIRRPAPCWRIPRNSSKCS
jgi:hypothetical protein